MNDKALIFGSSGQDGFYLNQILENLNIDVLCSSRSSGDIKGDVGNFDFVNKVINDFKPSYIFHLAATSSTLDNHIQENFNAIISGTFNILETSRRQSLETKVFISGSAFQFSNHNLPLNEKSSLNSNEFYSFARTKSLSLSRFYRRKYNIKIYFGFLFNHDSPLRNDNFFCKKIINLVKEKRYDHKTKINLGDLSYRKEFSYAKDIMEAVYLLVTQDKVFEAVIGSGTSYSLKDWVEACFQKEQKNFNDFIEYKYFKNSEILVSDPSLIKSLGWVPKVDFEGLVDLMYKDT